MDYYSMKRRELQALCKEHHIPANSANSVMADKLSELLNEKQKPRAQQKTSMNSSMDTTDESEPAVLRRQAKKVRFSPDVELLESGLQLGKKPNAMVTDMKVTRKSAAKNVDNNDNVELIDDGVQIPVRLTRSRLRTLGKDGVVPSNENKQSRRAVKKIKIGTDTLIGIKDNSGKVTRSKVHPLGKSGGVQLAKNRQNEGTANYVEKASESVEEKLVGHIRVTRSKAQTLIEDDTGPNLNPQVKKRSGRRVVNDAENVEPPKESVDIPARVTRARGQTLTVDSENTVGDPQAKKKRTRRDTSGADLSNKSSNVALGDNQDLPKRKLLRNREVVVADEGAKLGQGRRKKRSEETIAEGSESQDQADKGLRQSRRNKSKVDVSTVLNQNVSKEELVNNRKVTRSRAPLTMESSGGNDKNDYDNKVEEPLEHAGRRNVTRRKSVIQPAKTEVVLHLEEPVKRQSRKDARRKSVMQKAEGKKIDKPLNGKREIEIENEMVRSPDSGTHRTVKRKQSKEQCDNLSMVDEGLYIKEKVTELGKATSENEMKTVASVAGSQKSRKRRGDSIIEDQIIEIMHVSPVEESPRRSTRSVTKSEVKSVTHPRQNSVGVKQESNFKSSATRMDTTSKKRVKLSGTKQSDSLRRFTRSAIRSEREAVGSSHGKVDRKKPSQSAIEDQHIGDVQLSSRKVANFRHNPVLNTAPSRLTHSGIKHVGNAGTERSELSKGVGQILEDSNELSASDSERLPIKVVEENTISDSTERAIGKEVTDVPFADIEKSSIQSTQNPTKHETTAIPYLTENLLSGKKQAPVNLPKFEDETLSGAFLSDIKRTPFSTAKVSESVIDAPSDGSHLQNQSQAVYVKSAIFGEAEVQEAVDSVKSILKSVRPDIHEKEMESTKSGSLSMGLQDMIVEEPVFPVGKNDVKEITKENDDDAYYAGTSAFCQGLFEQSDVNRISKELEAPLEPPKPGGGKQLITDDGAEQDALTANDSLQNHPFGEHEVADNGEHDDEEKTASVADQIDTHEMDFVVGEYDLEPNKDNAQEQSIGDDNLQRLAMDEKGIKDVVSAEDKCDVADGIKAQEMDFIVGEYDMEPNRDIIIARDRCDSAEIDGHKMESVVGAYDMETCRNDSLEQLAGDDKHQGLVFENENKDNLVTARGRCDVADNVVDAGKELVEEVEREAVPSGNDVREILILGKSDREDANVNDTKEGEGEADSMQVTAVNMLDNFVLSGGDGEDESASANMEHESSPMMSTDKGGFDVSFMGKDDDFNMNRQVKSDILETPLSGNGVDGKDDVEGDSTNMYKEPEPVLPPLNAINTFEVPDSGNDAAVECDIGDKIEEKEGESKREHEQLMGNDSPVADGRDVRDDSPEPFQNENMAVVPEALVVSTDQELDSMLKVAVDVDASIGQSDSSTSIETPEAPAISGNVVADVRFDALESKLDINNYDVSNDLRDSDVIGNAIGVMDTDTEQNIMGTSEFFEGILSSKREGVPIDMINEQITEEGEPTTNDHEKISATVDHDSDGDKVVEDHSNHGLDESDSQLVGIMETHENPTGEKSSPIMFGKEEYQLMGYIRDHETLTEEHLPVTYKNKDLPVDYIVSDPPTLVKNDDRNKQEKSENTSSSLDWENYSFRTDGVQKPVSVSGSEDVLCKSMKDEQDADLQTSARACSSIQESYSLAVDFVDSIISLEKDSRYVADGKSIQDVDMLKENANTDLSAELSSPDSSLKVLLTTPATTQISSENAVSFTFHDDSCDNDDRNEKAAHDFNRQWENEPSSVSNDENQGYATQNTSLSNDLINETFGVEDFDDKEVDGSGKKEHFEFKDDQIKQHDLSIEAAGTHHSDYFSLNDNSLHSVELGIKEVAQPEGSETVDDSAASKGI